MKRTAMVTRARKYTAEEFLAYAELPENAERRLELVDGTIVEMPPSRMINTVIAMRLVTFLNLHIMAADLGYVTGPDGGYILRPNHIRQPDVGFVVKARYPDQLPNQPDGGPDIAVEVVSPREDVLSKAHEYFQAGTRLVWAIYPDEQLIHVLRPDEPRLRTLTLGDTLTGEDVLPGFELALDDLFPQR